MSSLDLACLALVLLAAVAGAVLGAISQAGQLAAVAAGWLGARLLAPELAPLLAGRVPAFAAQPLASVLAFAGCAVAGTLLVRAFLGVAARRGGGADRGLGALLGAAKAALVLWVALSALAAWGKPFGLGRLRLDPRGSELVAAARERPAFGTPRGGEASREPVGSGSGKEQSKK